MIKNLKVRLAISLLTFFIVENAPMLGPVTVFAVVVVAILKLLIFVIAFISPGWLILLPLILVWVTIADTIERYRFYMMRMKEDEYSHPGAGETLIRRVIKDYETNR